ncbi:TolC family protein [Sorangium sp. So ce131]|uniref:TolC family protein n=1 Tax=Sorangium sp. So ce131 TaxID=3133282 RepID=UPI003F5FF926
MAGLSGARGLQVLSSVACLALAACGPPPRLAAGDRAVALYREGRVDAAARARAPLAARPGAAPSELRVDEAVAMAKRQSGALAAMNARADTADAQAEAEGASVYRDPEIRVSQLRLDQVLDGAPRLATGVRVRPPRPGEAAATEAAARAEAAVARAEARAVEVEIEAEVRWLFDDVLLIDAEIAAHEAVASARRRLADQQKAQLDASQTTAIEEAMAALSAVEAEAGAAEQRERRKVALAALLERVGLDPAAPVRLVGDPAAALERVALPAEDALIEAALRRRPEIEIAAAGLDAAAAKGDIARGQRWPWLSFLEVGYEFSPATRDPLGWTFEAGIEVPLFNLHAFGKAAAAADAEAVEARRAFAGEVQRIAQEVRDRLREVRAAEAVLESFRARALPVAERAGVEIARSLESRQIHRLDALDLDERRAASQLKLLKVARAYRTALAELRSAVGGRLDTR